MSSGWPLLIGRLQPQTGKNSFWLPDTQFDGRLKGLEVIDNQSEFEVTREEVSWQIQVVERVDRFVLFPLACRRRTCIF